MTAAAHPRAGGPAPGSRSWRALLSLLVAAVVLGTGLPAARAAGDARLPAGRLAFSARGAAFIATFEGFVPTPYADAGNCSIGFGHLIHLGSCTAADQAGWGTITRARGLTLLRADAGSAAAGIRSRLAGTPLTQGEFDALVSFVYNIGLGGFDSSSVQRDLRARPPLYAAVPEHLTLWVYSGGQFLCGLYRRRVDEGHLFRTGSYALSTPPCPAGLADGRLPDLPGTAAPATSG